MTITTSTWEFVMYTIHTESDVFRFEDMDGNVLGYVLYDGNYGEMVKELDSGADPIEDGWEDGVGNTLDINGWGN